MEGDRSDSLNSGTDLAKTNKTTNDVNEQQPCPLDFSQTSANINLTSLLTGIERSLAKTCDAIMSKMDDLEKRVQDMEQNLQELMEGSIDGDEQKFDIEDTSIAKLETKQDNSAT